VNLALPTVQRDLGLSVADLDWVASSYILTFASLLLVGGRLADSFGRRRVFLVGNVVFALASLAAGLASSPELLLTARVVQGVGAALVTPTTLAIIGTTFPQPKERNLAIALWTAISGLAFAVGPVVGGAIAEYLAWGWIFFVNVPIGLVTVALGGWAIVESRDPAASRSLDLPGLATSGLALLGLTYGLIEGSRTNDWTAPLVVAGFVVAGVSAVAFPFVERRTRAPLIDLTFFRNRVFTGGNVAELLWGLGTLGAFFYASLYLQSVLGLSPSEAGLTFVPMALLLVAAAAPSMAVAARIGTHRTVAAGLVVVAVGLLLIARLDETAGLLDLLPGFVLLGVGSGLATPLTTAVLGSMPKAREGVASGILDVFRELSGLLGLTIIGAIILTRQSTAAAAGATQAAAFLGGFRAGLVVAAVSMLAGAAVALATLRTAPADVRARWRLDALPAGISSGTGDATIVDNGDTSTCGPGSGGPARET
jgi:EmrB/QacA subfamily drug resistance transporter